jgi:glycosyltransferase involved in cell wall biosynthesis
LTEKRLKTVLQFINSFHQGGSERQAVQLARLLTESGRYRVRVACLDSTGVLREEVERLGLSEIPEYPLQSFYDRNMLSQLRRAAAYMRAEKVDVVQTHDFYTNIFGILAAQIARVPVRVSSRRETLGMRTPTQKRVERGIYRLSHAVVANSEAVRQQLVAEGVRAARITTIYNGLDIERVRPSLSRDEALRFFQLPRAGGRHFVTIVANLRHRVKDHGTFLRAARRVHTEVPEAAFVLAGEGELADEIRAQATELGLGEDVFLTGRCERVADLLAISDVCVLSSRAEGFSNSILEYMAAGRAVVATRVGGAGEVVIEGETGYLVEAGDDEQMAARIISLLRDRDQARRMGARGREIVEQKFSCAAQLERTASLYDQLLMTKQAAHARKLEGVRRESV